MTTVASPSVTKIQELLTILLRSAIGGSVALAVISPDPRQWFPEDLNIVVPLGRASQWCRFLATAGFIERPILNNGTGRFTVVNRRITASITRFNAPNTENAIVILESAHDSILLPILSSPTTTHMNFITHNQIFCPYPALTMKKLAIHAYHGDSNHRSRDPKMPTYRQMLGFELKNIRLLLGTSTLEGECRLSCTEINRRFRGFRGIGIFHWAMYSNRADENDDAITDTCLGYEWSLGNPCMNSECELSLPVSVMTSSMAPPTLADTSVTSPSSPPSSEQTTTLANSNPLFTKSPSWNTEDDLPTLQDLLTNTSADVKPNMTVRKLSITVAASSGKQKTFKIKQMTKQGKMLRYFASSYGKELFVYDGERVDPESTAQMYDMEDDGKVTALKITYLGSLLPNIDVIDAMIEQIGGLSYYVLL
ncbi:hypothetical protein EDD85DRAFT_939623 [Armillaria nabsnona]|nr:hypothetical protein EDD85DRAFT_939623 [Armillaria nabsnona]